jgi:hypothetical protein
VLSAAEAAKIWQARVRGEEVRAPRAPHPGVAKLQALAAFYGTPEGKAELDANLDRVVQRLIDRGW